MSLLSINGKDLARSVKAGCIKLEHNRDQVDMLNVFPVPDGDTGTNMYLTLMSAVKEGEKHSEEALAKVAKAVSTGSLMGARGNSGVILSQIFRGMAREMDGKKEADAVAMAKALRAGSDTAYKAIMKPVEGTVLTVIRQVAAACEEKAEEEKDILAVLLAGVEEGYRTLQRTPDMLPVLKEAGVVDAGGQGLLFFLEGVIEGLANEKDIQLNSYKEKMSPSSRDKMVENIKLDFQYCTEVLVKGQDLDTEDFKDHLGPLGDCMIVVGGDDIVKIHIHSNHPGKVLETALQFGSLSDIKINNMLEEVHEHLNNWDEEEAANVESINRKIGLVAVGAGNGIVEILKSLGVDEVVEGGQTMNPSTEDLLNACNKVNAEGIIILPNNSNIIMAAEQVKHLCEKGIEIVPSKSVMQAITALIAYDSDGDLEKVSDAMKEEMLTVSYAEVTTAVRDSDLNGLDIKSGDVIGIIDGKISLKTAEVESAVDLLLAEMLDENSELITLLYGEDQDEDMAQQLKDSIMEKYPDLEVEMHLGGQPHYSYFLSVE